MLSKALIEYASPTLNGIKVGSLFPYMSNNLLDEVYEMNEKLKEYGVKLEIILNKSNKRNSALLYLYRPKQLMKILSHKM